MSKFELSHAVALFSQQTVVINNLWQVYVVATFAAAGFGISVSSLSAKQLRSPLASWHLLLGIGSY